MKKRGIFIQLLAIIISLLAVGLCEGALSEDDQSCLGCHGSDMTMTLKNGDSITLKVASSEVEKSVHGAIGCSACHGFTAENHQHKSYKNRRELSALSARQCLQCHSSINNPIHKKLMSASAAGVICTDCHGSHRIRRVRELARGNQYCLTCHQRELSVHYRDGENVRIQVEESVLNASVHKNLSCVDCHVRVSAESHPVRDFKSKRDFVLVMSDNCRRCHFDKYSKTLEGMHFKALSKGNTRAPVCTDCHGSHAIASARSDRLANAKKCRQCHSDVYDVYAASVHGAALINESIGDVPICSDCHKAHDNAGPHSKDFRISVPQTCAGCHAKKEVMQKYGISTRVVDTYLQDFHGVTMKFYRQFGKTDKQIAVCIDCHGVHDISRVRNSNAAVVKQNLTKRCRKCHPDATSNFPDSWISHYEPNFRKAPVVSMIDIGYRMFIPFMVIGLVLQIALHIWRYIVNR